MTTPIVFFPEAKPTDRARSTEPLFSKKSSTESESFASVMDQAKTPKSGPTNRATRARAEAGPCECRSRPSGEPKEPRQAPPRPASRVGNSKAAQENQSSAGESSAEATPEQTVGLTAETRSPESTAPSDARVTNRDANDGAPSDPPATAADIIPLLAPAVILPFPVEALPRPIGGTPPADSVSSPSAFSETGAEPSATSIPTPSPASFGHTANVESDEAQSAAQFNVLRLGLNPVAERERLAIDVRDALSRLEELGDQAATEHSDTEIGSKIIPFPGQRVSDGKIVTVQFNQTDTPAPTNAGLETKPQLPVEAELTENSAQPEAPSPDSVTATEAAANKSKSPAQSGSPSRADASGQTVPPSGTPAARKEKNMDSRTPSDQFSPVEGQMANSLPAGSSVSLESPRLETSPRQPAGSEWPAATSVGSVDRSAPDVSTTRGTDPAATVERISRIVGREAVFFRQHTSESMSVVLRPDANTELFLHLSQRNGQIEASIRCERGDFHQLNALWSQLQESLSHQKVRLTPLQESASDTGQFRNPGGFQQQGRDESSRQPSPGDESMDEWPAPASPGNTPAHVRSRRESGQRLTTSRPGWETWA